MSNTEDLHRLRHGKFITKTAWAQRNVYQRHQLLVEDIAAQVGTGAVVSHFSAAVLLGLPIPPEVELTAVWLTWPGVAGRGRSTNIRPHRARIDAEDVVMIGGIAVTSVARTIYDLARSQDQRWSVSVADAALRENACSKEDFAAVLVRTAGRRGAVMAWQVMTFADPRASDDLRSQTRVVFARVGLPPPDLAVEIGRGHDDLGSIDFEFPKFRTVALVAETDEAGQERRQSLTAHLIETGRQVCLIDRMDLRSPRSVLRLLSDAFNRGSVGRWHRRPPLLIGAPRPIWQSRPIWQY